jgi:hypothetical protein
MPNPTTIAMTAVGIIYSTKADPLKFFIIKSLYLPNIKKLSAKY